MPQTPLATSDGPQPIMTQRRLPAKPPPSFNPRTADMSGSSDLETRDHHIRVPGVYHNSLDNAGEQTLPHVSWWTGAIILNPDDMRGPSDLDIVDRHRQVPGAYRDCSERAMVQRASPPPYTPDASLDTWYNSLEWRTGKRPGDQYKLYTDNVYDRKARAYRNYEVGYDRGVEDGYEMAKYDFGISESQPKPRPSEYGSEMSESQPEPSPSAYDSGLSESQPEPRLSAFATLSGPRNG